MMAQFFSLVLFENADMHAVTDFWKENLKLGLAKQLTAESRQPAKLSKPIFPS